MKRNYKVIYKDSKGSYQTVRFMNKDCAFTFAQGMDGIVLHA